jgi:putative PIN family toxin of toxin-antitoxin system
VSFERLIFDTNVLISAVLMPGSSLAHAVRDAFHTKTVLYSSATLDELRSTLMRPKLDRYISQEERAAFLDSFAIAFQPVAITHDVQVCRDPRDDKFLALARSGNADLIVTGDDDLLTLHPWQSVSILSPRAYAAL